ncbi:AAA family ATPase [Sansalvadorimonas sp. 2012CJ34-2]|uniref:AAA family ATPase n=1 Tax=Parendozoicomonas callyspongiae TaxID=2942213 RepID=A0ABT0PLX1_9GAMM|nr:AAA family ATPase [Sansalvadorimonas sp. 2012CJ34-2]MCL6272256.1 AAA family ATPase [Sansalvadorimonas sp. 2012CJ34-2]
MHQISTLEIQNFRSCIKTKVYLQEFTPLVGYNNAGKSNILKAIDALVKGKGLAENNFNENDKPLIIIAKLSGLTDEVLDHLTTAQKSSLQPYIENEEIEIRFKQDKPGTQKNAVDLGVKSPSDTSDNWTNPNGIPQAISTLFPEPTFINSMEDAAEDISKFKASNTIGKLISILQKDISKSKGKEISDTLSEIGKKLNYDGSDRLVEFSEFDNSVNEKIEDFFPGLKLNLHIPTPNIADLFKQGTVIVSERGHKSFNDFNHMGHGSQRAIQMTLIRHLAEVTKNSTKEGKTNLLLIDEPELYLHPQAIEQIRSSLKTLSQNGYQVIFSTHSPYMIENGDISITNIVRKNEEGTQVATRLKDAIEKVLTDNESQARLLFDTYNLGQILFSDRVLVAEGDTEKHVLPALFKAVSGRTMGEDKCALVIATGSPNIPGMLAILDEMNIPAKALVDLDFAFTVAQKKGIVQTGNEDIGKCLEILQSIQPVHEFKLNGGYPQKGNNFKASDIYELLAQEESSKDHILNLHNHLKKQSIWLWVSGAIEPHLSLEEKQTGDWYKFKEKISKTPANEVIHDFAHVESMVDWAINGVNSPTTDVSHIIAGKEFEFPVIKKGELYQCIAQHKSGSTTKKTYGTISPDRDIAITETIKMIERVNGS